MSWLFDNGTGISQERRQRKVSARTYSMKRDNALHVIGSGYLLWSFLAMDYESITIRGYRLLSS